MQYTKKPVRKITPVGKSEKLPALQIIKRYQGARAKQFIPYRDPIKTLNSRE